MDNNNNPKSYTLNWEFITYDDNYNDNNDNELKPYEEKIYRDEEKDESIFSYIAELEFINKLITQKKHEKLSNIPQQILEIAKLKNSTEADYIYNFITRTFGFVSYKLKTIAVNLLQKKNTKAYSQTKELLKKNDLTDPENKIEFQKWLKQHCDSIVNLFQKFVNNNSEIDDDFWHELETEIIAVNHEFLDKNGKNSELLSKYLSNKRCVGGYTFKDNKKNDSIPLVAFSGYCDCVFDCKNRTISAGNDDFLWLMEKICGKKYRLVTTTEKICKYKLDKGKKVKKDINLHKALEDNTYPIKDVKADFSCVERKIFTAFNERKGIMYTSKENCARCQLAILFYRQKGISIKTINSKLQVIQEPVEEKNCKCNQK